MKCTRKSGILGLSGATYQLDMADKTHGVAASFMLQDDFGMVLEGGSGAFHKAGGENSFEFAMPSLTIKYGGGTITMNGETATLAGGNLWLDRQTIGGPSGQGFATSLLPRSVKSKPLYTGNWLAVNMNDTTVYNLVFFWPPQPEQWKVGSELHPPVNPIYKIGIEYPPCPQSHPPVNGVNVLGQDDFDLNILKPHDTSQSPHWKSPMSNNTYCSAWQLKIKDKVYTMTAWVRGSEVDLGTYFFEGAASIWEIDGGIEVEVGRAFVEQMGYN